MHCAVISSPEIGHSRFVVLRFAAAVNRTTTCRPCSAGSAQIVMFYRNSIRSLKFAGEFIFAFIDDIIFTLCTCFGLTTYQLLSSSMSYLPFNSTSRHLATRRSQTASRAMWGAIRTSSRGFRSAKRYARLTYAQASPPNSKYPEKCDAELLSR